MEESRTIHPAFKKTAAADYGQQRQDKAEIQFSRPLMAVNKYLIAVEVGCGRFE